MGQNMKGEETVVVDDDSVTAIAAAVGAGIPSNASVVAIKAKTDLIPATPAAVGSKMDLADTLNATGVAALKSGLGTVPASGDWSTAAAMLLLFAQTADATNSHTGALGGGATWPGATALWGNKNRLDLVGSNDQSGTLSVRQRVAGVWYTDTWTVPIHAVGAEWKFATARKPGADAYNVQFVADATALTGLEITASVTVGEVDHHTPLLISPFSLIAGGGATIARPIGARSFDISAVRNTDDTPVAQMQVRQQNAAAGTLMRVQYDQANNMPRLGLRTTCVSVRVEEASWGSTLDGELFWYA